MKSPKHLAFIRQLPCIICGDNTSTEAAHIRFGDRRVAKPQTGMGTKPSDEWTVPLCGKHHREQHAMNEVAFWVQNFMDPLYIAMALARIDGNHEDGEIIIAANREAAARVRQRFLEVAEGDGSRH